MKNKYFLSDKDYKTGVSLMVRFCLDFVVVKNNEILLSKREIEPYKGFWHLPGGIVRKGESIKEAAGRILKSELGLMSVSAELAGYIEYLDEKIPSKRISTHSVSVVFKARLESGKITGSSQAREVRFFSKVPDRTIPEVEEFLQKNWKKLCIENKNSFC